MALLFTSLYVLLFFYSTYTMYKFQTKRLQSQGTYISGPTWDPSQKTITK